MEKTAEAMIAALDAFVPHPIALDDERRIRQIMDGFEELPDKIRALPAMFCLMERCPEADLGTPGPLVRAIESLDIPQYLALLMESVRRRPMYLNLWMINRVLNATREGAMRTTLLHLFREIRDHSDDPGLVEIVNGFLEHQGEVL
jgi:hypothetical protein